MVAARTKRQRLSMATIGSSKKDENGFTGAINTLTLTSKVRFVRNESESDKGTLPPPLRRKNRNRRGVGQTSRRR